MLSQFGKIRTVATHRYAEFVPQGVHTSAPWSELKEQVLLGSEKIVSSQRCRK
jgi:hypothetical protein